MTRGHQRFRLSERAAGILCHPTSLPGRHGIGDLGAGARAFVDFLQAAGQRWWQMLPVHPVGPGFSPYSALSAFAASPLLIDLEALVDDGLLRKADILPTDRVDAQRVIYPAVTRFKTAALRRAFAAFTDGGGLSSRRFMRFRERQAHWLQDHALFSALRRAQRGRAWLDWPAVLRRRQKRALAEAVRIRQRDVDFECFLQFVFDEQWRKLRAYAHAAGVGLIGDIPIFVAHDSSDVWARQELFDLDTRGRSRTVSGVPPDCFSRTGQRWGHPQYRWPRHVRTDFAWWLARFGRVFEQFDAVRIDHFLGFNRVWVVPGRAKTALRGEWKQTPGEQLFATLRRKLGRLAIIAEDLGVVVPEAIRLRERWGFPGMRLLHFAFGNNEGDRYNQPHNHPVNCVVYPGTHDNETTREWFTRLKREHRRERGRTVLTPYQRVLHYTGTTGRQIHWDMIRLAYGSPARLAVIPLQDVLGLGAEARMNTPATTRGNWVWRVRRRALRARPAARLRDLALAYERAVPGA
jgi:4-alpha-glucanotransferase